MNSFSPGRRNRIAEADRNSLRVLDARIVVIINSGHAPASYMPWEGVSESSADAPRGWPNLNRMHLPQQMYPQLTCKVPEQRTRIHGS